jgi:hypothetical protein
VQESLQPTDVYMNFGAWSYYRGKECGTKDVTFCPKISKVCKYLNAEHNFRVWWMTSPPALSDVEVDAVVDIIPPGHHLHLPTRCKLDPSRVVDRSEALELTQPDVTERYKLFWNTLHLHAEANHSFNKMLLKRLKEADAENDPQPPQHAPAPAPYPKQLWSRLFGSQR